MDEFALINAIVKALGDRAVGDWVRVGPGDDAAVIAASEHHDIVSSIDTLVEGVHFPAQAPADLIGYRALMVSLSDLAAMAAVPRYVLVGITIPAIDDGWAVALATGMRRAAQRCDVYVCGGNIAQGPLTITVSVHGEVRSGKALLRNAARIGDGIFVSGPLGGAAACVRTESFELESDVLEPMQQAYYRPTARFDLGEDIRAHANSGIDVSDGLLQDLGHVLSASGVGARLVSTSIPICPGALLEDALHGGDDYELLCTARQLPSFVRIGEIVAGSGIRLDDEEIDPRGFNHFIA